MKERLRTPKKISENIKIRLIYSLSSMQTNILYFKKTTAKSLPLVGARLLHAATDFINMIIIAKLGLDSLAAGSLIASTSATIFLMSWAMLFPVAVVVAYAKGHARCHVFRCELSSQFTTQDMAPIEIGKILKSGCILALIVGLGASIIMWNANYILSMFHQPQNLIALATPYFHILALAMIPSALCVCFNEFAIGILKTHLVIIWRIINTPLTLFLSYGLVLGKFGLPKIGITGAALGYTITYWGLAIGIFVYFSCARNYREYCFYRARSTYAYLKQLFIIGWPISIQLGAIITSYTILTYMMGWFGKTALAANQIIGQCATIVAMIPYGISQASSAIVAQTFGANKKMTKAAGFSGIYLGGIIVVLIAIIYWTIPKPLISIYLNIHDVNNIAIISLATLFLYINGFNQIVDALSVSTLGALRGLSDTKIPMFINIASSWLTSIPVGYILAFKLEAGAAGLYLGFALGSTLNAILLIRRFKRNSKF